MLSAAIVLVAWVFCTGALHLDGLADAADAWVGGHGNRERTLAIMKDPYCGPIAVAAVVCVLLLKFSALAALGEARGAAVYYFDVRQGCALVCPPLLARAAIPALFAITPYVRQQGIGAEIALHQSRPWAFAVVGMAGIAAILLDNRRGALSLAAAAVVFIGMRRAFVRRLDGVTGDCAGAMIEIIEAVSLVAIAAA
jgi:adenosylcobinamide-GDP ribazoletransferase